MHADGTRVGAAFVAKRSPANPRQILVDMIEANAGASKDFLFDKFRNVIDEDTDLMRAVAWYFFVNFYEYETTTRNRKPSGSYREAQMARDRSLVEAIKEQIVRMNLVLPNGKMVRDANRTDLQHAGGWFVKVAKKLKAGQTVSEVLTEADLQAIK